VGLGLISFTQALWGVGAGDINRPAWGASSLWCLDYLYWSRMIAASNSAQRGIRGQRRYETLAVAGEVTYITRTS